MVPMVTAGAAAITTVMAGLEEMAPNGTRRTEREAAAVADPMTEMAVMAAFMAVVAVRIPERPVAREPRESS